MTTRTRAFLAHSCSLLLALTYTARPAAAATSRKQCLNTCQSASRACLGVERSRLPPLRATCTGNHAARARCLRGVGAVGHIMGASCRRLRKDCRACCRAGGSGPSCPVGQPVAFDAPAPQDLSALELPRQEDGQLFVLAIPNASLAIDPTLKTPVTALGKCADWITSCFDPAARSLDDCARSATPCATDQPWQEGPCCPPACFDAYQARRRMGVEPLAAFSDVYFSDASCFPGLRALLEGGQ